MNPEALLQQLNDIKTPEPVGWWPLAPVWWVLIFVALLALAFGIYRLYRTIRARRYRKQALGLLKHIEAQKDSRPREKTLEALLALLKRAAITAYPHSRDVIANLYGHDFFVFLEATAKSAPPKIDSKWHYALYQKQLVQAESFPMMRFFDLARFWLQQHQTLNGEQLQQRLTNKGLTVATVSANPMEVRHA